MNPLPAAGPGPLIALLYLVSAVLFVLGLKGLTRVASARRGSTLAAAGMLLAVVGTLLELDRLDPAWIAAGLVVGGLIGGFSAVRVPMTAMPEMVALFNGAGGGVSNLIALAGLALPAAAGTFGSALFDRATLGSTMASILLGAVTLSGSVVAFMKLRGWVSSRPVLLPGRHVINLLLVIAALAVGTGLTLAAVDLGTLWLGGLVLTAVCLLLGVSLVLPIGGADMPVVIALLNSYSGLAVAATGFLLDNPLLIITGALVGASGIILTRIMCKAMNRTMANVVLGGFGAVAAAGEAGGGEYGTVRSATAEDVALLLEGAESVVVVPGYGLAVAQAQHAVKELAAGLERRGSRVSYAIHPVAGRMPGHMNVLLAEADVPYEQLVEMDAINPEFASTDVALVIGANDVVNPAARTDPGSPIHGMPVLEVWRARSVVVVKRSLSPGFAGIRNELFERENTVLFFDDGKRAIQAISAALREL